MPSTLGKEASEVEQQQKLIEEGMYWETTTSQEENPRFTFKMKQNSVEVGPKDGAKKLEDVTGPIAMIFDTEEGWIGEKLGPQSGHWKRLVRKAQTQMERASPEKIKRESLVPLQELDANIIELRTGKRSEKTYKRQKCEGKSDGGVAATTGQCR